MGTSQPTHLPRSGSRWQAILLAGWRLIFPKLPLDCSCCSQYSRSSNWVSHLGLGLSLSAAMYVATGAAPEQGERPLLLRCYSFAAGAVLGCH